MEKCTDHPFNITKNAPYCNDPKLPDRQVWQTVQTKIRLLLEEQSNQGLHCLLLYLHLLEVSNHGRTS